jgi:hypothetical protein
LRIEHFQGYCGLRDAEAEAVPATSSEVPLLECAASTELMPFAAAELLLAVALTPPAAVSAAGVGFCAVAAAVAVPVGLGFCVSAAGLAAVLALLTVPLATLFAEFEVADLEAAAVEAACAAGCN